MADIRQFDIILVHLDPTKGGGIRGTRPCVVLQTNGVRGATTLVVVPFTTGNIANIYPFQIAVKKSQINGLSANSKIKLEQIRTISMDRCGKKIGSLEKESWEKIFTTLDIVFDRCGDFR